MLLVVFFGILFVYRLLLYIYRWLRCVRLKRIYLNWLNGKKNGILRYEKEIRMIFSCAAIHGLTFSPNIAHREIEETAKSFERAIGCFKYEVARNFFPHYWIKKIVLAPIEFLDHVGIRNVPATKAIKVILQIFYWAIGTWDIAAFFDASIPSPLNKLLELLALIIENVF